MKVKINPLLLMAAMEISFLRDLPEEPKAADKLRLNAIFYKYFGTIPSEAVDKLLSAARQSRKARGNWDVQYIILKTLASARKEPTAVDIAVAIGSECPLLIGRLYRLIYMIETDDGVTHDLRYTPAPIPTAIQEIGTLKSLIQQRWSASRAGVAGSILTDGMMIDILNAIDRAQPGADSLTLFIDSEIAKLPILGGDKAVKDTVRNVQLLELVRGAGLEGTEEQVNFVGHEIMGHTYTTDEDLKNLVLDAVGKYKQPAV